MTKDGEDWAAHATLPELANVIVEEEGRVVHNF
jgi:hypothetical protein